MTGRRSRCSARPPGGGGPARRGGVLAGYAARPFRFVVMAHILAPAAPGRPPDFRTPQLTCGNPRLLSRRAAVFMVVHRETALHPERNEDRSHAHRHQ